MKSFLQWAGGKSRLLPVIHNNLPLTYNKYFEPFVGGGAVLFSLFSTDSLTSQQAVISDLNEELINCYNVIKHETSNLIKLLEHIASLKTHSKDMYLHIRNADRDIKTFKQWTPVQKASRFLYLNKACFNGLYRVNSKGFFNTPYGNPKSFETIFNIPNILECAKALQNVEILNKDFNELLPSIKEYDFVYLDPPYYPVSKTSNFVSYTLQKFKESDLQRLKDFCDVLTANKAFFLLSNSNSDYVKTLFDGYHIQEVSINRLIGAKNSSRGKVKELLISNY